MTEDECMQKPLSTVEAVAALKVHLHTVGAELARTVRWRSLAEMFDQYRREANDRRLHHRRKATCDG